MISTRSEGEGGEGRGVRVKSRSYTAEPKKSFPVGSIELTRKFVWVFLLQKNSDDLFLRKSLWSETLAQL